MFIDADVIFFSDIALLWKHFEYLEPGQIMAMGEEGYRYIRPQNKQRFYPPFGLNNGFMLVDIASAKKSKFIRNITGYYRTESDSIISHKDEGLMNLYFKDHPQELHLLDCDLIFHGDLDPCSYTNGELCSKRGCSKAGQTGAYILHGTSGRFKKHAISQNSIISQNSVNKSIHVVAQGTQVEYYHLYKAFEEMDVNEHRNWAYWQPVLDRFVRERSVYCGIGSAKYSNGLLQRLKKSLSKWISSI